MSKLPNFLCVGAGKSGTTALYHYLKQHPEVFLPHQKELHFFAWQDLADFNGGPGTEHSRSDWCKTLSQYERMFVDAAGYKLIGDISPSYLHAPNAPALIKQILGAPKIIILLRNPVDKVISQFMHLRRDGREKLNFPDALNAESKRIEAKWGAIYHYVCTSKYSQDVARYQYVFGVENVGVWKFDSFVQESEETMREICAFLNIDIEFQFSPPEKINRSGKPRSRLVGRLIGPNGLTSLAKKIIPRPLGVKIKSKILDLNTGNKEEICEADIVSLRREFSEDLTSLQKITGIDFD